MKRRTLFSNYLITILFILVISSAGIQQGFKLLPEMPNQENRALDTMPDFNPSYLDAFPRSFEAFYNDHFAFRNHFLKMYADMNFNIYKKCPYPDQVIIGYNQHLFMIPKELDTYQRTTLFTKDELDRIRSEFSYRKNYFQEKGIDYFVAVCPIKYSIYPEYLPWYMQIQDTVCRTDQFLDVISGLGIEVIDLRKVLLAAKDSISSTSRELFMATDNHWNEIGAFVAYQNIASRIARKQPRALVLQASDYTISPKHRNGGNLANILNMREEMKDVQYTFTLWNPVKTNEITPCPYKAPDDFYVNEFFKGYSMQDGNQNLPRIMMVHDSFGKFIHPYFRDSFSRSVFIWDKWQYKLNEPIIDAEKPDVYISMTLESLLPALANNCEFR
jgi:hypothetical protein